MADIVLEIKGNDPELSVAFAEFLPQQPCHLQANVNVTTTGSYADAITSYPAGTLSLILSNPGPEVVEAGFGPGTPEGAYVVMPGSQREIFPPTQRNIAPLRVRHL